MSSQKWLTSHSKYKNTSAGVGDSVARQARDVGRRWLNAGPTSTTLTHHRTSPDQTPLPAIIIHTEVGPSKDHQLSVDDLINH